MTVQELINLLNKYPMQSEVEFYNNMTGNDYGLNYIDESYDKDTIYFNISRIC